jgi:hypothetical protein
MGTMPGTQETNGREVRQVTDPGLRPDPSVLGPAASYAVPPGADYISNTTSINKILLVCRILNGL